MGYGKFSGEAYTAYSAAAADKPRAMLFARSHKDAPTRSGQEVNVEKIGCRESRDSETNPNSLPVIVGLDVSGSMGMIAEQLAKQGLGTFVGQVLERTPVADPHLLFLAIGDAVAGDRAPLQATQFEADNKICDQLTDLYLEGGGGGNDFESYDLAWAFAVSKVNSDAWEKRKAKGYLFTIGDEMFPKSTSGHYLQTVFGGYQAPTPEQLLTEAQERYAVFHVVILQGNYCLRHADAVMIDWRKHLGKRVLPVSNYAHVAEVLVSAIAVHEGTAVEDVLGWWPQNVQAVVRTALGV